MRRRIVLGSVALLLAALVGGLWVAPGLLDWSQYKDGIAALASARLGRPVHIGGAVTLQLLPQPVLTATDVAVEDVGDGIDLRARALRLRVGLGPLLAGQIDARELTLQGAEIRLPWPPQPGALAQRPPESATRLRAQMEDSRLQVGNLVLAGIEATLTTDPDTGTLATAGLGEADGRRWQFTARLTRPGRDGAAGLGVSLDGQGPLRDTGGTFSGQIGADGALSGRVAGRGPDLSKLMPAPALPWRGDGRLSAAAGLLVADDLALEIDGAPARGAVALRVEPEARLDVSISAGRLDLDAWLPALLGRAPGGVRPSIATGIDLSAEAATLAGGTLRRLRGAVDLVGDGIALREVSAVLPGGAQVTLSGQVTGGAAPAFEGPVRLDAPDLRTTLHWLDGRWLEAVLPAGLEGWPPGVLRTAALSAHVMVGSGAAGSGAAGSGAVGSGAVGSGAAGSGTVGSGTAGSGQVAVTELQGALDGVPISGTATVRLGSRPALTAALVLDRLAVDAWVPDGLATPSLAATLAVLDRMRGWDSDVRLQVAEASWHMAGLGAVVVELQTEASRVFLRRLEAQPLGLRLTASGQAGEGGRLTDVQVGVTATDLSVLRPVLAGLPARYGMMAPLLRGPGSAVLTAAGPPDAVAARLTAELSDLRVEAQPVVNGPAQRAAGALTLHHPGAPRLLETLGLGGTAAWLGDGSMSLVGQLSVRPGQVELTGATLAAGALRMSGQMTLAGRLVTGQVSAETLPLPLPYLRSPEPLPVAALRGWEALVHVEAAQVLVGLTPVMEGAATDLSLEAGVLRLAEGSGRVAGGMVVGAASVDASADPPQLAVQAQATGLAIKAGVFDAPLDVVAGEADVAVLLSAAGHSPAALLATLAGTADARVRDGVAAGFDLAAAGAALEHPAEVGAALVGGRTPFSLLDVRLRIARGVASTEATMTSLAGSGRLAGSVDLLGGTLDARLSLQPLAEGAPVLDVRLIGPALNPVRTPELAGLARWLAERP